MMPTPSASPSASTVLVSVLAIAAFMRPDTIMRYRSRTMMCGAGIVILSMKPTRHSTSSSAIEAADDGDAVPARPCSQSRL